MQTDRDSGNESLVFKLLRVDILWKSTTTKELLFLMHSYVHVSRM